MTALRLPELIAPLTVDGVRDVVVEARAADAPVRIAGAGSWLDAGAPVASARTLSLHRLSGITEYVPGDLTITARAGTSLAELSHVTASHGQWLGLDPAGSRQGTIGATIATASSGPLAHAFGTPRDLVLGVEAVTGYGDVVKPGGRVVKNVAGFDLVRLYTGAWGTLGPITQVTLRLRAMPVHDVTLAMPVADPAQLGVLLQRLRDSTVSLLAAEWVDRDTAVRLGVCRDGDAILLRLGGNDRFVRGQRAHLDTIADNAPCDPSVWSALSTLESSADVVVRYSGAADALPARITRLRERLAHIGTAAALHASLGRGVLRVIVTDTGDATRRAVQDVVSGEQRIVERLPSGWWSTEADPFAGGLASRIRHAFDPDQICNRRQVTDA